MQSLLHGINCNRLIDIGGVAVAVATTKLTSHVSPPALVVERRGGIEPKSFQPENLLLVSEKDDALVKVADFGFAQKFMPDTGLTTQCGTPGYVAPEILMRK